MKKNLPFDAFGNHTQNGCPQFPQSTEVPPNVEAQKIETPSLCGPPFNLILRY
jgi:hypothetical protein